MKMTKPYKNRMSLVNRALALLIVSAFSSTIVLADDIYEYSEEDSLENTVEANESVVERSKVDVIEAQHQVTLAKRRVTRKEQALGKSKQKLTAVTKGKKFFKAESSTYVAFKSQFEVKPEWINSICSATNPQVPYQQIDIYYNAINSSWGDNRSDNERGLVKQELAQMQRNVLGKMDLLRSHRWTKDPDVIKIDVRYSADLDMWTRSGVAYICNLDATALLTHKP